MPISGYLGLLDPGRISTLSTVPGDKARRRKLKPSGNDPEAQLSLYVYDCSSHEPVGAVIPVMLHQKKFGGGWEELGRALCCPLCWRILVQPDGVELPAPKPPVEKKRASVQQKQTMKSGREKRKSQKSRPKSSPARSALQTFLDLNEPFSVKDIMESTGLARTGVRKIVMQLVEAGLLEIVGSGGHGIGDRTIYQKAP